MNAFRSSALTLSMLLILTPVAFAGEASNGPKELGTLEELDFSNMMQHMEVTTASKQAQSISDIAAPIYVITAEDMRRAGANSIPEAIRLAPGVVVGQIDQGKWVVGVRGFAWQYASKALVLLDGRAVYSPIASDVYWDSLDVPIEDIERIEVIRGPGDARWGSHAVNGIINIITKPAGDVRGVSLSAMLDSDGSEIFTARGGGALSSNFDYRAYAKYLSQGDFPMAAGVPRLGNRDAVRAGLRVDGVSRGGDRLIFIGDVQDGSDATLLTAVPGAVDRYDAKEWSALARWERGSSGRLNQQAQLSFDHLEQEIYEERDTFDFAYQAQLPEWRAQTWTVGGVFKSSADVLSPTLGIFPSRMTENTYGVFVHDHVALNDKVRFLFGSQFEHNPFTGWEAQPNLQFLYAPDKRRSFWASVSRAVRTPLRTEEGFLLDNPIFPGTVLRFIGDHGLKSESVLAWQAGVRMTLQDNLFLDLAAFYSQYEDLVIVQGGAPFFEPLPPPGQAVLPATFANSDSGATKGVEAVLKARPFARWNLVASYSLYSQPSWRNPLWFESVGAAVEHQFQIHSSARLGADLEWNADLYYTGELTVGSVPDYYKLDTQLAWAPWKGSLQLAVGVKNALDSRHREAGINSADTPAEIPRTGYLKVLHHF